MDHSKPLVNEDSATEKKKEVGERCELHITRQRYKRDGTQETVVIESLERDNRFDVEYAIVINQKLTDKNVLDKTSLTINSKHILKAFKDVIISYPTVASDFTESFDMESPFQMLYHYWDDLDQYRRSLEDDNARMHMNLLFEFMEIEMGIEKRRIETQIKKGQVDYSRLWTIFRPGDLCVKIDHGNPWLLKTVKTAYEENETIGKYVDVLCTYTDYDGINIGEANHIFRIIQKRYFASENPAYIIDLPVFPRKFLKEDDNLEKNLLERGNHFITLKGICTRQYDGLAVYLKEPPLDFYDPRMGDWDDLWWPYKETGRVVIDRKTFQEDHHLSQVSIKVVSKSINKLLFPPFVYGFSLARKEWCRFYLTCIQEIIWEKDCFNTLVMKENQKRLLQAVVSSHKFPENPRDDMQQKGKGLVILLHGTPGSGKTLTAECTAELMEKPLFSTNTAELNKYNRAWYFEYRLKQVLQYATIWKAIVLLDEADVFLQSRKDNSANSAGASERNALVAVFLRHLEYFSGIVFLTTNLIDVFDQAMKSRIHLALSYKPPEEEMRRLIWTQTLKSIPTEELDMDFEAIEDLILQELNGREITNSINTARTLSRFDSQPLQLKHIQTVLDVKKEFDVTLRNMASLEMARGSKYGLIRQGSLLEATMDETEDS
jgi:AAA+ superfamily predicted ATPase